MEESDFKVGTWENPIFKGGLRENLVFKVVNGEYDFSRGFIGESGFSRWL